MRNKLMEKMLLLVLMISMVVTMNPPTELVAQNSKENIEYEQTSRMQYETDFSAYTAGEQPAEWTSQWNPAEFTIHDQPRRMVYEPGTASRSLVTFDEPGEVQGDVEVAGVVRAPSPASNTKFQLHLHVSGDASATESYYVDISNGSLRLNRYSAGAFNSITSVPFDDFYADRWYQVVLQRENDTLRAKVWLYGEDEPDNWMIEASNSVLDSGHVGVGHFGTDTVNEWAWFAVGTDGETAPRPPDDFLPLPEEPDEVTGVTVEQNYGFATVSWDPLDDASEYEIERTKMNGNEPDEPGEVVGRWFPNRYTNNELTFADSGFVLGEEYQWRVRAVFAGIPGEWSDPVVSDTQQPFGPDEYRTEFEINGGEEWTSHTGEQQLLQEIADNSDRAELETVGQTAQGRPLNLLIIGDPAPRTTDEIADSPSVLVNCTIHGTEPAPREACLMLLRDLAFSDDERVSDLLEDTTVLIAPTANPDGRAVNSRENSAGQDLNRDHLLLRHPETFALAEVMRDYQPDLVIDGHEYQAADTSDLSAMWARSPNVGEDIWAFSQDIMTRGELFGSATNAGWWPLQYPLTPSDGWEALLQNAAGLKNHVGLLVETRRRPGPTRPAEGDENTLVTTPENQQRRVYTQLWSFRQMLDFYQENIPAIQQAIINAESAASNNEGPVYLDGMRDVPVTPPVNRAPTMILDPAPCGYLIDEDQYTREDGQAPSVQDRLDAHGIEAEQVNEGIFVSMEQPLRGLIPLLLDSESSHEMVPAERLYDCEDLIPDPTSAAEIKDLAERFNEEGEFESEESVRLLVTHLSAVSHYEDQKESEKVVRHMRGFQDLLDYQQENDLISQKAFNELYAQSENLINQWE